MYRLWSGHTLNGRTTPSSLVTRKLHCIFPGISLSNDWQPARPPVLGGGGTKARRAGRGASSRKPWRSASGGGLGTIFPVNPYASFLGDCKARDVIAETPGRLAALAARLGPDGMERSLAPGKWAARAIVCHLADCELAFAFRLRQALAEPHHVIQPFDQEAWSRPYGSLSAEAALETFQAVRRWNQALLETVPADQFSKKLSHPERGEMTFQTVIETMGGHDRNHLQQIERLSN